MERIDNIREQLRENLLKQTSGVIEFRTSTNNRLHKRRFYPKKNLSNKWYYGVDDVTEETRKQKLAFVDPLDPENPHSSIVLKHMDSMDLSVPENRMVLKWLLYCEGIAMTQEEAQGNRNKTFFIYVKELDMQRKASFYEVKDKAIELLNKMSKDSIYDVSRLMGYDLSKYEPEEARLFIRELFDMPAGVETAKKFVSKISDPLKETKLLFLELLDNSIIKKTSDGYLFGEIYLGASQEAVMSWMNEPRNAPQLTDMRLQMETPLKTTKRK